MFDALIALATKLAQRRAAARRQALCAELAEGLPAGVRAESVRDGVRLSGRALQKRLARDRALASLIAGVWQ